MPYQGQHTQIFQVNLNKKCQRILKKKSRNKVSSGNLKWVQGNSKTNGIISYKEPVFGPNLPITYISKLSAYLASQIA